MTQITLAKTIEVSQAWICKCFKYHYYDCFRLYLEETRLV